MLSNKWDCKTSKQEFLPQHLQVKKMTHYHLSFEILLLFSSSVNAANEIIPLEQH